METNKPLEFLNLNWTRPTALIGLNKNHQHVMDLINMRLVYIIPGHRRSRVSLFFFFFFFLMTYDISCQPSPLDLNLASVRGNSIFDE